MLSWPVRILRGFTVLGLLFGLLFFGFSLTPSLLPRGPVLQGILSGISFAVGYGVGSFLSWLWCYLALAKPGERGSIWLQNFVLVAIVISAPILIWKATGWQNVVRHLNDLEPLKDFQPFLLAGIALVLSLLLIFIARGLGWIFRWIGRRLNAFLPRRVANVLGVLVVLVVIGSMVNGLVFKSALRLADKVSGQLDRFITENQRQPENPQFTGSAASLVRWENIGRMGREFVSTGPSGADIAAITGRPAIDPIRVYVGLRSAGTATERARLALRELQRVNGFSRKVLIVAMPTGTGWLDASGVDTIEFLHGGDTAVVAAQYSYLASWLSLMVEPGFSEEMARTLFGEIYRYWVRLPATQRPRLILYGLSLGGYSSESSVQLFEVVGDPFDGAVWVGPPFASPHHRRMTESRDPDSPVWLPRVGDGSYVRFTSQKNALDIPDASWGPMRIVYLQYANDPIVFFDFSSLYRKPEWLIGERGPDVSPDIRWFPVVTFLQTVVDMIMSASAPKGHGHRYAAANYIDAWIAATEPDGWDSSGIERLKAHFKDK